MHEPKASALSARDNKLLPECTKYNPVVHKNWYLQLLTDVKQPLVFSKVHT